MGIQTFSLPGARPTCQEPPLIMLDEQGSTLVISQQATISGGSDSSQTLEAHISASGKSQSKILTLIFLEI
jgi:hypothetical protein